MRLKSLFLILCITFLNYFCFAQSIPTETKRNSLVEECKTYIGTPYLYGGLTKDGIDCSGLVFTAVRDSTGIQLPRTVKALYSFVRIIPDSEKQKGDLVFFKTVESKISHVGIYIGKNQFIHSVSDGPNTGVIVSSLKESYWKTRYVGVGSYFPADNEAEEIYIASNIETNETEEDSSVATSTPEKPEPKHKPGEAKPEPKEKPDPKHKPGTIKTSKTETEPSPLPKHKQKPKKKTSTFDVDTSVFINWNLYTTDQFLFNVRGVTFQVQGVYNNWNLRPGIGIDFKYEPKMNIFQIPMYLSLSPRDFLSIYAGTVFTFGKPVLIGTQEEIKSSIFPGVIGFSLQTPAISIGKMGLKFVQDVNYTIFNKTDNFALSFADSLVAGLVFQSGIRLEFYIN